MRRLFSCVKYKFHVLLNGRPLFYLAGLLLLALTFLLVYFAVTAEKESGIKLAVFDECGGESSEKLVGYLKTAPGFGVKIHSSREAAENAVYLGKAEASLIILPEYDRLLAEGETDGLIVISVSPSSLSTDVIVETAAGGVMAEKARLTAVKALEREGYDTSSYDAYAGEFVPPTMVTIRELSGTGSDRAIFGRTFPGAEGFYALALMLVMLTLSKKLGGADEIAVSKRYAVLKSGRAVDLVSDVLALFSISLIVSAAAFVFLPDKSFMAAVAYIAYAFAVSGLSLFAASLSAGDRHDAVSPVFALVTSIIGGCFADTTAFPKAMKTVSYLTLQGQFIASSGGKAAFIPVLIAVGILFALLSRVKRRG